MINAEPGANGGFSRITKQELRESTLPGWRISNGEPWLPVLISIIEWPSTITAGKPIGDGSQLADRLAGVCKGGSLIEPFTQPHIR